MKHKQLLTGLLYGSIAFCIALFGAGCIVTAFSFDEGFATSGFGTLEMVDMQAVAIWSAVFSAAGAWTCLQKRKWIFWLTAAVAAVYLLGNMWEEIYELAYRISIFFDKAYRWGTLAKQTQTVAIMQSGEMYMVEWPKMTGGLVTLCAFVSFGVNWALCRQRKTDVAVIVGSLPLAVCCVVTDTVPDEWYFFPLLAMLLLVILTHEARGRSRADGVKVTALLMVPVLLVTMLLSAMMPRESYETQSENMLGILLDWARKMPGVGGFFGETSGVTVSGTVSGSVNLAAIGSQAKVSYPVMHVTAPVTQLLYLRGQSFDTYDGKSWTTSEKSTGYDSGWPRDLRELGTVTVSVQVKQKYHFVPYYTSGINDMVLGVMDPGSEQRYSYTLMEYVPSHKEPQSDMSNVCLQLPEKTRAKAEALWEQIWAEKSHTVPHGGKLRESYAQVIGEYVKNSAVYSLNTPQMPWDMTDFALWFLKYGETGYCVHFATAATVLLRAAGVPARYVTGYTADAVAGERVVVTADKSHAWVEYLNDYNVWTVLDPTPEEASEEPTETLPPEPTETEPTEPETTERPTEPETTAPDPTQTDETQATDGPTQTGSATVPSQTGEAGREENVDRTVVLRALNWVIGFMLGLLALTGQYALRRQLRKNKLKKGSPNQQALARWHLVLRMADLTGLSVPEELEMLAEKAKFSQHTLTDEELARLDTWLKRAQRALRKKPWPVKLMIRLIWAV